MITRAQVIQEPGAGLASVRVEALWGTKWWPNKTYPCARQELENNTDVRKNGYDTKEKTQKTYRAVDATAGYCSQRAVNDITAHGFSMREGIYHFIGVFLFIYFLLDWEGRKIPIGLIW